MFDYQQIIDRHYPDAAPLRDIYMRHCRSVSDLALEIAARLRLPLDSGEIEAAAMLHDIGIFLTDAPGIHCHGTAPYLTHGAIGADLLRSEGAPEELARVAERHTGAGLSPADVITLNTILASKAAAAAEHPCEATLCLLPTDRSYLPESLLGKLICYADKFYSKSGTMERKPLDRVIASITKFGPDSLARFQELHRLFSPA